MNWSLINNLLSNDHRHICSPSFVVFGMNSKDYIFFGARTICEFVLTPSPIWFQWKY